MTGNYRDLSQLEALGPQLALAVTPVGDRLTTAG